ncbi:MAG: TIGR04282 family arsenosugar biosynthesis glycosyltransferase [Alphaproteobacteria bacterium]
MTRRRPILVIFTRTPRLGRGKRRLALDVGPVRALHFQRTTLERLRRRVGRDRRWTCILAITPDRDARGPGRMAQGRMAQGRGDLGERMARVFSRLPPGPVLLVGGDIPGLDASHVARAFRLLEAHDVVLGPAGDGGFWLVGLRRRPRGPVAPFDSVRWSTPHALADTLANLSRPANRRLSVALADRLDDVDDGEALVTWARSGRSPSSPAAPPPGRPPGHW